MEQVFTEEELIPISALQHVLFCERQYALIHIEQVWEENRFTAEGRILHERVDEEHHESRKLYKNEYGMAVRSLQHGLIGKTDLVEFIKNPTGGYEKIIPVEFKRGRNKEEDWDRVQLCAETLCLEEMFDASIREGQFYYLQEHRRTIVSIDPELRQKTMEVIDRIRVLSERKTIPKAIYSRKKCDRCSLIDICMPKYIDRGGKNTSRYMKNQVRTSIEKEAP